MTEDDTFEQLKYKIIVDEFGNKFYFNHDGQLHREDGPAVIRTNGSQRWYINGELHREDGPAVISAVGTQTWYINNQLHRKDGPAIIWSDGDCEWWVKGNPQQFGYNKKGFIRK